jgi:pimeloyl-ACP methyl ester carboxylesterase
MAAADTALAKARHVFSKHGGILRTSKAMGLGIHPRTLYTYPFLDKAKFPAFFAADVSPDVASFMADSQVPWGVEALGGAITQPAWRTKPSWYLITTEDKMIPPDAQHAMSKRPGSTVVEVKSSHAMYVSHPQAVAYLIEEAATGAFGCNERKTAKDRLSVQ